MKISNRTLKILLWAIVIAAAFKTAMFYLVLWSDARHHWPMPKPVEQSYR